METPFAAYTGDQPYVFVCYAHEDSDVVYPDIAWLHEQGVNLWYDEGISAGKNWRTAIGDSLFGANQVLFYVSGGSLRSDHCNREINLALDEDKEVVPVYLEDVELTTDLKVGLNRVQALHREHDSSYRHHLLNALGQALVVEPPTVVPLKKSLTSVYATLGLVITLFLVTGWWYWQATETDNVAAPLTAIAVLPFDDLSPDADQRWLADGMAEALIESLNRIDELRITSRSSTTILKQRGATIHEIGEQLNVGTVVEGSIRRSDGELNVVAQWIRVDDESHMWAARYERKFDDVFDLQKEIAIGIAEAIRSELDIADDFKILMPTRYQPADVRAWEYYTQAYHLWNTWTPDAFVEAADLCRNAIEIDPLYAPGYSCLAFTHFYVLSPNFDVKQGVELAKQAVELDPSSDLANFILAFASVYEWDFAAADKRARRVLDANPKHYNTQAALLRVLWSSGRQDRYREALERLQRYVRVDPLVPEGQALLGQAWSTIGNYEKAIETYEHARSLGPISTFHHVSLAMAYQIVGRSDRALASMIRWVPELNEDAIRSAHARGGWEGLNLHIAETLERPDVPCFSWHLAHAGSEERMYECLEQRLAMSHIYLPEDINRKDLYLPYWEEPRFQELIGRVNDRIRHLPHDISDGS